MFRYTLFLAILFVGFAWGCKKYEEGPGISLRSSENRVINTWEVDKYIDHNEDETHKFAGTWYEFKEDGVLEAHTTSGTYKGTWDLFDNQTKMFIAIEGPDPVDRLDEDDWEVTLLKNDEMWLYDEDADGDTDEIRFITKP